MIPEYVNSIIEGLEEKGFEAFVVGGGLRDLLLDRKPNDFDVTTSATPDQIISALCDFKTIPTGLKHGTVTVISNGEPVEVTTYRIDGEYNDARHPESVQFTPNIKEDLARRDFTVNAMAYSEKRGFVDPYGGKKDLFDKLLRAVGNPEQRMREDALRIMRAFRFSAQLGFEIEAQTEKALCTMREGLSKISAERRAHELLRLLLAPYPEAALEKMVACGVSDYVLGDYRPSSFIISNIGLSEPLSHERLAFLLWECPENRAREILHSLKYSNAIISKTLSVLSSRELPVPVGEGEIRRFIVKFRSEAESVSRIKNIFCKDSFPDTETLDKIRKKGICCSIGELAIDGKDLMELGFFGKDIGRVLSALFELVTEKPEANTRENLLKVAGLLADI